MKKTLSDKVVKFFQIQSPIVTVVLVIICVICLRNVGLEQVLAFTPSNLFLAALILWGMYAVKSLSIVFPLTVLFMASGVMFPLWLAFIINLAGLCISFSLPYALGRISGTPLVDKLVRKYPKAERLRALSLKNDVFTGFFTRAIAIVPGDVVSMLLGAMGLRYPAYLLGSQLGMLPGMILQTLLGYALDEGLQIWMIAVFVALMALCVGISVYVNKRAKNKNHPE